MADKEYNEKGLPVGEEGADEAPSFYANVVQMSIGPFDVTMDFGFQSPEGRRRGQMEGTPPRYQRVARISMSHAHAKSMIPLIAGLIAKTESQVGNIPTPGFDDMSKE